MRKPQIDVSVFKKRREQLAQLIQGKALILTSHPDYVRNNDVFHNYRQDSNFYYLTGFEEPGSIFVFRPGQQPETIMFVRPKDVTRETWDGFRYGPEGVEELFGIDKAFSIEDFEEQIPHLLSSVTGLFYRFFYFEEYDQIIREAILDTKSLLRRSGRGNLPVEDSYQLLGEMRIIKSDFEIEQMRTVGEITAKAHLEVMKSMRPGLNERALHGVFIKSIMEQGCPREAYPGIFASGSNATTLHYVFNDQPCKEGEMFLVDAGGEYNYYAGDITRTYPVNGKFTADQKRVYQRVLDIQKDLLNQVRPGVTLAGLQNEAIRQLTRLMLDEKLLTGDLEKNMSEQNFMRYYPHGVSHFIGMDVHDAGLAQINGEPRRIEPRMAFTVEPGLYVPASDMSAPPSLRGLGIRIEDNVIVTEDSCEVTTLAALKEVNDLEELIGQQ